MARLTDNQGRLLGGLEGLRFSQAPNSEHSAHTARVATKTPLAPRFGPEETVPGLGCSYGASAYSRGPGYPHRHACHNPVEAPDERHHCDLCGGDFCSLHAEPAAHACTSVLEPALL